MNKRKLIPARPNAYQELAERAKKAGTSIYKLCRDLNIPNQTMQNWKKKDPDSIATLRKFEDKLTEIEARQPAQA